MYAITATVKSVGAEKSRWDWRAPPVGITSCVNSLEIVFCSRVPPPQTTGYSNYARWKSSAKKVSCLFCKIFGWLWCAEQKYLHCFMGKNYWEKIGQNWYKSKPKRLDACFKNRAIFQPVLILGVFFQNSSNFKIKSRLLFFLMRSHFWSQSASCIITIK